MGYLSKALFTGALLSAAALTVSAGETVNYKPETVSFDKFRSSLYCPAAKEVQNGRIIYSVKGEGLPAAYIMFCGATGDKIRIDVITAEEVFTACRNGKSFWSCDKENGYAALEAADVEDMKIDTPFFPFPFQKNDYYGDLVPSGTGIFRTVNCDIYESRPLDGADFSVSIWIDGESKRLCMISAEDEEGVFSTSFRNYKEFDGVELATHIGVSSPEGVATLTLKSAEWNVEFPEEFFTKGGDLDKDSRVLELQKYLADVDARKAVTKEAEDAVRAKADKAEQEAARKRQLERDAAKEQKKIDGLRKELARLDVSIAEKTAALAALEEYIRANVSASMETAKEYARTPRYRHTWSYRGWRHWTRSGNSKQRRLAKKFYREAEDAGKDYDKIARELSTLRLQRTDVQMQLEKAEQAQKSAK